MSHAPPGLGFGDGATMNDFIAIGEGSANVVVEDSGTTPNVNSGYCQSGVNTVTFTNNGVEVDPGFGTMINVETGISLGSTSGGSYLISDGGFDITQITVAGVIVPLADSMVQLRQVPNRAPT